MSKLKLGAILDEKPVKMTVDLPAAIQPGSHCLCGGAWP